MKEYESILLCINRNYSKIWFAKIERLNLIVWKLLK
jgi:hypothetical protein